MPMALIALTARVTFIGERFQKCLPQLPAPSIIIADEVHNAGGQRIREVLPNNIKLRLGLSATPERHLDEDGTQAVFDYFGPELSPIVTLADALKMKVLTPYDYWPLLVELTAEEQNTYFDLSEKIARAFPRGDLKNNVTLQTLLFRRARLLGAAENKLDVVRELYTNQLSEQTHTLIYCGDGKIGSESSPDDEGEKQISAIRDILKTEFGRRIGRYTQETSPNDREVLLSNLRDGSIDALVAIKCLDEGVDMPSVRNAVILASATNPRQFIQRRGRILRKAKGKEFASIYDCIVVPPSDSANNPIERKLIIRELKRFAEFADLARNGGQARLRISELQERFNLRDI